MNKKTRVRRNIDPQKILIQFKTNWQIIPTNNSVNPKIGVAQPLMI